MTKTQLEKLAVEFEDLRNNSSDYADDKFIAAYFKLFPNTVKGYGNTEEAAKADLIEIATEVLADFDPEKNWHPDLRCELYIQKDEELSMMDDIDQDIANNEENRFMIDTFETLLQIQKDCPEELEEFLKDEDFKKNYDKILEWNRILWNLEFR